MHPRFPRLARTACGALITLGLVAGCAEEPSSTEEREQDRPIVVSVDSANREQRILGELYQRALLSSGRVAYPYLEQFTVARNPISIMSLGDADVIVGCTGQLLNVLDPVAAKELSRRYVADVEAGRVDKNSGQWREEVYVAMVKALPAQISATDPSNAVACSDYDGPELPQNVVPLYRKPVADRQARLVLNSVSGTITTEDLKQLAEDSAVGGVSVSSRITDYLESHDL